MNKITIVLLLLFGFSVYGDTQTYHREAIPFTGNETWNIDERSFVIEGSIIIPMLVDREKKKFEFLLAVKAEFDKPPTKEDAPIAKKIAKYALNHGYFNNAKDFLKQKGITQSLNKVVGVALLYKNSFLIFNNAKGYRYQFPIEELE